MIRILAIGIASLVAVTAAAQENVQVEKLIRQGNEFYKQKQYDQAEAAYSQALSQQQNNTTAAFNRANALYRLSKPDEAMKVLDQVVMNAGDDADLKAKAYYNKGVILSAQKNLEGSIEEYKNSLRQNPNDQEARENLQKALTELKKKTPPPKPKEDKKKQQQKKQQQQPKMNQQEAEQRLKLLEQKEKDVQQRLQQEKSKAGAGQQKDW